MKDIELLQYVHETAQMGIDSLKDVSGQASDDGLRRALGQQIAEYQKIADQSTQLLTRKGQQPKDPSLMAKLSSEIMSTIKTLTDHSSSKIAEMVIQGNTMGITKSTRHLHDYAGDDSQVRQLAERLLKTEQDNVEQMKPYL